MTIDSYSYNTLNSELHEIRLLTLESGSHDEALQCRLSTVALATRPTYNALSYVWGDPVVTITEPTIVLDGQRFVVTPNLYSALRHLRPPPGIVSICLWVDAVCINQGDLDERNEQVAMMRDIYASATQVTIWLGEADDDSDATFDALSMITGHKPWPQEKSQCSNIRRHCGNFFFFLDNRRSWLSRVWILQELAMARNDPVVVCGHKRASWSEFVTAWQTIAKETFAELGTYPKNAETANGDSINERDDFEPLTQVKLDVLDKLRQAVQSRGGDRLRQLLMISRTSAATDPRDRIYGLLGLLKEEDSNPESSIPIPIDYRKNCAEVYTDAMAHIFSRGEGPYFLSGIYLSGGPAVAPHVPFLPEAIVQPGLPSWVPDFSRQESGKSAQPGGYLFHPPTTMHASGAGQGAKNGWILSDGQTLQVEGLIVDKIVEVTSFGTTFDVVKAKLVHLEDMAREARRRPCSFASSIAPLMQRFRDSEPLWRILISNKHLKSGYEPAPSSYEEMYTSLLKHHGTTKTHDLAHNTSSNSSPPSEYERSLYSCVLKSFLATVNGFIGTCPPASCPGDVVAIVFGSPSPFVLRPIPADTDEKQKYWLIGPSYIGGIMNGEMVDELYCEDLMDSTTFFIR
jgi:hypothetical protein